MKHSIYCVLTAPEVVDLDQATYQVKLSDLEIGTEYVLKQTTPVYDRENLTESEVTRVTFEGIRVLDDFIFVTFREVLNPENVVEWAFRKEIPVPPEPDPEVPEGEEPPPEPEPEPPSLAEGFIEIEADIALQGLYKGVSTVLHLRAVMDYPDPPALSLSRGIFRNTYL